MNHILFFLFIFFFCKNDSLKIGKIIGSSIVSSSLLLNNHIPWSLENAMHSPSMLATTKVSIERNNIYLYGSINAESCEKLKNEINNLEYNGKLFRLEYNLDPPPINLHIQSEGGSLMSVLYIVDLIENLDIPIHTYIDGYSASAASLLNVIGDKRFMTKNSMMLIHQLTSEKEGKYQELDDDMKNLQMLMNKIKTIYLRHSTIPYNELIEILKHDIWLDADTCKKYGLVDEII